MDTGLDVDWLNGGFLVTDGQTNSAAGSQGRFIFAGPITIVFTMTVVLVATGCDMLQILLERSTKPSARLTGIHLKSLSLDAAQLALEVEVKNPYSVALPLVDIDYALSSEGQPFLSGQTQLGQAIPAGQTKAFTLPTTVRFLELLDVVKDVEPGTVVPYQANVGVSVDVPQLGLVRVPLQKDGQIPVPTVPSVELTRVDWKSLDLQKALAVLNLQLVNNNQFPVDLRQMGYGLSLAGKQVAEASVQHDGSFNPGQPRQIHVPISISPIQLGLAFFEILKGQGADYEISGNLDLDSPFGPMSMPYTRQGKTTFSR